MNDNDRRAIDRRTFLGHTARGTALVAAAGTAACRVAEAPSNRTAVGTPADTDAPQVPPDDSFELREMSAGDLQAGLKSRRWTSKRLVELYSERIRRLDRTGPNLHAIIELNPDATAIAESLDAEYSAKGPRSSLHGLPIVIKDNIDTADKMRTTAGSLALAESIAPRDAYLVERLRQAGAVILAKTNLSEWANFRSTRSSSGWSARGGQCRNPYVLDRNPCGSSSGSAVAVAASLAALAVGTETDGSIVCPANNCGLVGIKPTVGLISRSGIIPIAASQDTAGPMARTVADAVMLLSAMVGSDPRDPATVAAGTRREAAYSSFLDPAGLKGARVGVARKFFGANPDVDRLMTDAIGVLKDAGAVIVDPADLPTQAEYEDAELTVLLHEFKAGINAYLAGLEPKTAVKSLRDLIAFNERESQREMPFFGQELFIRAEATSGLESADYRAALARCRLLAREKGIDAVVAKDRLDALVAPTAGPAWTTDLVNGDHFVGGSSSPAAVAGYPSITVPLGFIRGLPVGVSFFGHAWSEGTLIKCAYAFERASGHRQPPRFLATLEMR
jgi:amidase